MAKTGDRYGHYTCIRRIGEGGMAETFLANQSGPYEFEQRVCIKVIREDCKMRPKFEEMFFAEATIAASLRHSNIVSVIDVNQHHGYMILELVDGVDLRSLMQATPGHRLDAPQVTYIALELVKALDFAHNRRWRGKPDGIVHRDIKPSNVLISYAGEVKLADFGIAKAIRSTTDSDGLVRGTPCYMSPEQIQGEPLDARSDLFSLGIVLYEMAAGHRPYDGKNDIDTTQRICRGEFIPLAETTPSIPAGLAMVVERLLRPEPSHRFRSAEELGEALDRFAPPSSIYRQLGNLARLTQPPETLLPADKTGSLPIVIQVDQTGSLGEALDKASHSSFSTSKPIVSKGQKDMLVADQVMGRPTKTAELNSEWESLKGRERSNESLSLNLPISRTPMVLLVTTVIVILLFGGILLFPSFSDDPPLRVNTFQPIAKKNNVPLNVLSPPQGTSSKGPELNSEDLSQNVTAELVEESANKEDSSSSFSDPTHSLESKQEESKRFPQPLKTDRPKGYVEVGVFPWGKVWIDGRLYGNAPVRAELLTGKHIIAGGIWKPIRFQSIRLKPDSVEQVVIRLKDDEN